jgi:sulfur-carrier protein
VPRVRFTSSLQRHVACPEEVVPGRTVRETLGAYFAKHPVRETLWAYFAKHPQTKSYVLDEQGALRHHVVVFVSGVQLRDRERQDDAIDDGAEIYVMQALSGG